MSTALSPEAAVAYFTRLIDRDPKNESALLARGVAHYHAGDAEGAMADCDRAVAVAEAGSTTALLCRGQILVGLERCGEAERDFSHVLDVAPGSLFALVWRIKTFKIQCDFPPAVRDCNAAINIDAKSAYPWISRALCYAAQGDVALARKDLEHAFAMQLTSDETMHACATQSIVDQAAGDFGKAISDLSVAISLASDLPNHLHRRPCLKQDEFTPPLHDKSDLLIRRAYLWAQSGRNELVVDDCSSAIEIDPTYVPAFICRAGVKYMLANYEEALADCNESLRLDPGSRAALTNRAACWLKLKEYHNAIADCTAALKLGLEASAYNNRGQAWRFLGEYDKAIEDYDAAIRLDPERGSAVGNRAIVYFDLGQYDKSVRDYSEAIRLSPPSAKLYASRASALVSNNEFDKARADIKQAIQLDASYALSYDVRGRMWQISKEYDKAIADYDRAIELDSDSPITISNRGLAWLAKGEFAKAKADFERSLRLDETSVNHAIELAELLATCPNDAIRDGKRAVEVATKACELSEWKDTDAIETLAAACAEAGDFDAAVKWERKAIELTDEAEREPLQERLKLYEAGKPSRLPVIAGAEGAASRN